MSCEGPKGSPHPGPQLHPSLLLPAPCPRGWAGYSKGSRGWEGTGEGPQRRWSLLKSPGHERGSLLCLSCRLSSIHLPTLCKAAWSQLRHIYGAFCIETKNIFTMFRTRSTNIKLKQEEGQPTCWVLTYSQTQGPHFPYQTVYSRESGKRFL